MIPLTDNENKFYNEQEECHICQKEFCYDKNEKKRNLNYTKKLEIIVMIRENLEELLIAFVIYNVKYPKKFPYKFIMAQNMIIIS